MKTFVAVFCLAVWSAFPSIAQSAEQPEVPFPSVPEWRITGKAPFETVGRGNEIRAIMTKAASREPASGKCIVFVQLPTGEEAFTYSVNTNGELEVVTPHFPE